MPAPILGPQTLYDKIWNAHLVDQQPDGTALIYVDGHLIHEVTSPQAFEGLRLAGRRVRRPDCTMTTVDHNIPTVSRKGFRSVSQFISDPSSRTQVATLEQNVVDFGLSYFGMMDKRQGIVHVIGPEQGLTLPGKTICCGDSHTSTHGAFGALAWGIGTSEIEHVLATQTLLSKKSKNMRITVDGVLPEGVTSKDVILHIIGKIGTAGGTGSVIEFAGSTIRNLSMEARMSLTNMSIEGGARAGLIAPDEITFEYLKNRPLAPKEDEWDAAVKYWQTLPSDPNAKFDVEVVVSATDIIPTVTWGTSPEDAVPITGRVPDPTNFSDPAKKESIERSLKYMGLVPNMPITSIKLDKIFIGSCTNSRIEDLRSAASIVKGKKIAPHLYAMVVPGSGLVKIQAEEEGLDVIFKNAGFDWREAGCSMCLGMNPDILGSGERCASTSNRNFEGRQGPGGRTHLMSPAMAAAAALKGYLADVREFTKTINTAGPTKSIDFVLKAASEPSSHFTVSEQDVSPHPSTDSILTANLGDVEQSDAPPDGSQSGTDTESSILASNGGGMTKFTTLTGIAAPIHMTNVDTDRIIPKQFLKTINRTGLGAALFYEIRFDLKTGKPIPDFVLNQDPWNKAKILICTGENFGCGSSREHAAWSFKDFGISCILAPSFGDIFFNNCFKNGMLPIKLPSEALQVLATDARDIKELTIDLPTQRITRFNGETIPFDVEEFRKYCLINGFDDIGLTMQKKDKIEEFEAFRSSRFPWLDGKGYSKTGKPVKIGTAVPAKEATQW